MRAGPGIEIKDKYGYKQLFAIISIITAFAIVFMLFTDKRVAAEKPQKKITKRKIPFFHWKYDSFSMHCVCAYRRVIFIGEWSD